MRKKRRTLPVPEVEARNGILGDQQFRLRYSVQESKNDSKMTPSEAHMKELDEELLKLLVSKGDYKKKDLLDFQQQELKYHRPSNSFFSPWRGWNDLTDEENSRVAHFRAMQSVYDYVWEREFFDE